MHIKYVFEKKKTIFIAETVGGFMIKRKGTNYNSNS